MYDKAMVLDYNGYKIWIKHVNKLLYCLNGVLISFIPQFDLHNVNILAQGIDRWYSPIHNAIEKKTIIKYVFEYIKDDSIYYSAYAMHLDECKYDGIDISNIDKIFAEYEEWAKNRNDIYTAKDCRDMELNQWLYETWGWQ